MKIVLSHCGIYIKCCFALASVLSIAYSQISNVAMAQASSGQVEVTVSKFRNQQGTLVCQIFEQPSAFPSNHDGARASVFLPITGSSGTCLFKDLPRGIYAIAVLHDENNNKKVDSNFLGVPIEGYGVSNNKTYALSAPKWDESSFALMDGERKILSINLRY